MFSIAYTQLTAPLSASKATRLYTHGTGITGAGAGVGPGAAVGPVVVQPVAPAVASALLEQARQSTVPPVLAGAGPLTLYGGSSASTGPVAETAAPQFRVTFYSGQWWLQDVIHHISVPLPPLEPHGYGFWALAPDSMHVSQGASLGMFSCSFLC